MKVTKYVLYHKKRKRLADDTLYRTERAAQARIDILFKPYVNYSWSGPEIKRVNRELRTLKKHIIIKRVLVDFNPI